jgi:hypothetical protein
MAQREMDERKAEAERIATQNAADEEKAEQKRQADKAKEDRKTEKTPEQIEWQDVSQLGQKLNSLHNLGLCINSQIEDPGNEWAWVKNSDLAVSLRQELLNAETIVVSYNAQVRTFNLISMLKKLGSVKALVTLGELKTAIAGAHKTLNTCVTQLDTMHKSMLRARDVEKKAVEEKAGQKAGRETHEKKVAALSNVKLEQLGLGF